VPAQVPADSSAHQPLWRLRSRQEAEEFWEREFGHLKGEGATQAQQQQQQQQEAHHVGGQHHSFVASLKQQPSPALVAATAALLKAPAPSVEQGQIRPTTGAERS
jgi:hypothetical protein